MIDDVIKSISQAETDFDRTAAKAQKIALDKVLTLTKELDTKNGRIIPNAKNLKTVARLRKMLEGAIFSREYKQSVDKLSKSFETIESGMTGYYSTLSDKLPAREKYTIMRGQAVENAVTGLSQAGIEANVTGRIREMLLTSVTTGARYNDMVEQMRTHLTDTPDQTGALRRYSQTYVTTALSQYVGQYNKMMSDDLGLEWYAYRGSLKATSRPFCTLLVKKEWVHVSELPDLIKGKIDGEQVPIYEKTGLPAGMISGTTTDNLIVNCGGWNCDHNFYPVIEKRVPESVRLKIKPTKE